MSRELPTLQDARDALALADSAANAPWADGVSVEVDSDYLRAALAAVDELTCERDELRAALGGQVAQRVSMKVGGFGGGGGAQ